jgi:hypothetical protein
MTADDGDDSDMIFGEVAERPARLDAYGFPEHEGDPPAGADGPLTFDEVFDAVTPPGTDRRALLDALKAAQRTGGTLPGNRAPDISGPADGVPDIVKRAFPAFGSGPEPADPFTPGDSATIAIADTYFGLIDKGVPVASVERIIGIWLGSLQGSEAAGDA